MAESPTPSPAPGKEKRFPCGQCGAELDFHPGSRSLRCGHCGFENAIPASAEHVEEQDFEEALVRLEKGEETHEQITIKCEGCAAETTLPPNVTAAECPYCGLNIVAEAKARGTMKPKSLLPFQITRQRAQESFRSWLGSLWFAPGELRRSAEADGKLGGLYVPYFTYDADTESAYTGMRGDHYWVSESYTTTENGQTVTRTRQVMKTAWSFRSGEVANQFDDLLVLASRSLPKAQAERLEPWPLRELAPYDDRYLSGFRCESHQVTLREGFGIARSLMEPEIRASVRQDIGGDEQQVLSLRTRYSNITFKHVLLPVWVSAYRYRDRVYRFLVNARTGEVQGERPVSWAKVALAVLAGLLAAAAAVYFFSQRSR